jgi:hypothetical protein
MYLAYRSVSAPSNGALSHGAIAGIVVAVVAFTAATTFGLWTYLRRRSPKQYSRLWKSSSYQCSRYSVSRRIIRPYTLSSGPDFWDSSEYESEAEEDEITIIKNKDLDEGDEEDTLGYKPNLELARSSPTLKTIDTIDPWKLEYEPNPVIFAHLVDCFGSPSNDEHVQEVLQTNGSRSPEVASEQRVYQNSKRRMSDSSDVGDLEAFLGHGEAPTMTSSQPKRRAYSRGSIQEPNRSISGLFMSHSGSPPVTPGPPNLIHTVPSSPAQGEPKSDQLSSDQSQRTTPASTLSVYGSTPESSAPSEGDQSLACTECDMSFRTFGQRREHQNRKHTRRFKCDMCDRAFNLQADLGRHERTVHKSEGGAIDGGHEESPLKCPNEGCKTADKIWDRKDNLWRHIVRCRKALGMMA